MQHHENDMVSVIIPCYNQGQYLSQAIESVLEQSFPNKEVIVIDDGSTDQTAAIAEKYHAVRFYQQENIGLSATRNKGLKLSRGQYIVFLDADDWLLPGALELNACLLMQHPTVAMVSGGHILFYEPENKQWEIIKTIGNDAYVEMLKGNYIGMPSAVMYHRWAAEAFPFNEALKNCEDYEQYFRILRQHPTLHHEKLVAVYRKHATNKSGNIPVQLATALQVLQSQEPLLRNEAERTEMEEGIFWLKEYYCEILYNDLVLRLYQHGDPPTAEEENMLQQYRPQRYEAWQQELVKADEFFRSQ